MLEISDLRTPWLEAAALTVDGGTCVALMGPSGAGKSLLLRAVADLDPNEGSVRLDGIDREAIPAYAWRAMVGLVPTESGWWADRVGEHFFAHHRIDALLAALGLSTDALEWPVARLSSGERQRLALVRALVLRPRVLLLDEPTSSLDAEATSQVEQLLEQQLAAGTAILMVTHDQAQAERIAERIETVAERRLQPRDGQQS